MHLVTFELGSPSHRKPGWEIAKMHVSIIFSGGFAAEMPQYHWRALTVTLGFGWSVPWWASLAAFFWADPYCTWTQSNDRRAS